MLEQYKKSPCFGISNVRRAILINENDKTTGSIVSDSIISAFFEQCNELKKNVEMDKDMILINTIKRINAHANLSSDERVAQLIIMNKIPSILTNLFKEFFIEERNEDMLDDLCINVQSSCNMEVVILIFFQQFSYYSELISEEFIKLGLIDLICHKIRFLHKTSHKYALNVLGNLIGTDYIMKYNVNYNNILDIAFDEIYKSDNCIVENAGGWLLSKIACRADLFSTPQKMTIVSSFIELFLSKIPSIYSDILGGILFIIDNSPILLKNSKLCEGILRVTLFGIKNLIENSLYHSLCIACILYKNLDINVISIFHNQVSVKKLINLLYEPNINIKKATINLFICIVKYQSELISTLYLNDAFLAINQLFLSSSFDEKLPLLMIMVESCINGGKALVYYLVESNYFISSIFEFLSSDITGIEEYCFKSLVICLSYQETYEHTKQQIILEGGLEYLESYKTNNESVATLLEQIKQFFI